MYKNYLIVISKLDLAGMNIGNQLSKFGHFNFYLVDNEIIYTENLDLSKINRYDFIIFASRHKSEKEMRTLSVHAPGNFRNAEFGGEKGKLCRSSALFQKQLFEHLCKNAKEFHLKDYDVSLECTHHGPLISKPCVFIEIGATEREWKDKKAGFVVAKTINDTMNDFKENPYNEIAIGIGGPHYAPNFTKIQEKSNVAISHIIPQYAFPLTEEMVKEAVGKTEEEIDFAVLDWKGLGTSEQRKEILDMLDRLYVNYRRTSEVSK